MYRSLGAKRAEPLPGCSSFFQVGVGISLQFAPRNDTVAVMLVANSSMAVHRICRRCSDPRSHPLLPRLTPSRPPRHRRLQEGLAKWRELNSAEHWLAAAAELNPLTQSLPQLVHHRDEIAGAADAQRKGHRGVVGLCCWSANMAASAWHAADACVWLRPRPICPNNLPSITPPLKASCWAACAWRRCSAWSLCWSSWARWPGTCRATICRCCPRCSLPWLTWWTKVGAILSSGLVLFANCHHLLCTALADLVDRVGCWWLGRRACRMQLVLSSSCCAARWDRLHWWHSAWRGTSPTLSLPCWLPLLQFCTGLEREPEQLQHLFACLSLICKHLCKLLASEAQLLALLKVGRRRAQLGGRMGDLTWWHCFWAAGLSHWHP